MKHLLSRENLICTLTSSDAPAALVNILCRLAAGSGVVPAGSLLRLLICTPTTASLLMMPGNPGTCKRNIKLYAPRLELCWELHTCKALIGFSLTLLHQNRGHQHVWELRSLGT